MKALLSGFYIEGKIGEELAKIKELHGSKKLWSLPIFTVSFLDNPAPLLLYDKVIYDERIAPLTIDYIYSDSYSSRAVPQENYDTRSRMLEDLFSSEIFTNIKPETILTQNDLSQIRDKVQSKITARNSWFKDEVDAIKLAYGENYASPSPLNFEAMNSELMWTISEKLSETSEDVAILDDCARGKLYRNKVYELVSENIRGEIARKFFNLLPTFVLGLPKLELNNVDAFLELHQSSAICRFREIVTAISTESDERHRETLIKNELYRANEQMNKINSSDGSTINLIGAVIGIGATATGLANNLNWLSGFGFASTVFTSYSTLKNSYERLSRRQKWDWFVRFKSFAEKQAGFSEPIKDPWPLSHL